MDNKSNLEKINNIMWQSLYYASLCSWLPLSNIAVHEDMDSTIKNLKSFLNKTENEIIIKLIEDNVRLSGHTPTKEYVKFVEKIILYMVQKDYSFETALTKTHKLKSYKDICYRKKELMFLVKVTINAFNVVVAELNKLKTFYTEVTLNQLKELHYLIEDIQQGEKELNISSELFKSLIYRQGLSYIPDLDNLLVDHAKSDAKLQMKSVLKYINGTEQALWGEEYVPKI